MKALIWRTVITEKKRSGFEVLPEGNRVGVSLLDLFIRLKEYACLFIIIEEENNGQFGNDF